MKIKHALIIVVAAIVTVTACTTLQRTQNPDGTVTETHVVDPKLTNGLAIADAVNSATTGVNPFSPLLAIGTTTIAAIAAWVAKRKNDKAAQSALLLKTVIQGVEQSGIPEVKAAIQKHAEAVEVEGELGAIVHKITS